MRAPRFWWHPSPSLQANLLRPLGLIYGSVAASRMKRRGEQVELPVRVQPQHGAADVGDEPVLLSRTARTIVSRSRPAGARLAYEIGATAVIMDDGLQNPSLIKDCAIAVVDGATGIGNGLPLPAGPLRASMAAQWAMIDAVLVIGDGEPGQRIAREADEHGKRVFTGSLEPTREAAEALKGRRVMAFAGIGRPEKFFDTLHACGAIVDVTHAFPDHHSFKPEEVAALRQEAESHGLLPVTTEKDLVRIANAAEVWPALMALPVRLRIENETGLRNLLMRRINERRLRVV